MECRLLLKCQWVCLCLLLCHCAYAASYSPTSFIVYVGFFGICVTVSVKGTLWCQGAFGLCQSEQLLFLLFRSSSKATALYMSERCIPQKHYKNIIKNQDPKAPWVFISVCQFGAHQPPSCSLSLFLRGFSCQHQPKFFTMCLFSKIPIKRRKKTDDLFISSCMIYPHKGELQRL